MGATRSKKRKSAGSKAVAGDFTNQPVAIMLKDGSYCIGTISGIEKGQVFMRGVRLRKEDQKLHTSGFLGQLFGGGGFGSQGAGPGSGFGGGLFGGGAGGPFGGGAGGGQGASGGGGFLGNMWSSIRFGMGMIQTIMPLFRMLGAFKI